jgi:anti-sigma factor ChrR (cupin superfamily)
MVPSTSHPTAGLQLDYRDGLCSAGAALAVATHLTLCPTCADRSLAAWGGRNLPGVLAADHGGAEAYANALGWSVLEGWSGDSDGVRVAMLMGAGIGEAVYLVDVAVGASADVPGAMFLVVLQGLLADGPISFTRGAFIDLAATPLLQPKAAGPRGCICLAICETASAA